MSRIYFHSPSGEVELHGSERAYLDGLCRRFAASVYNVNGGFRDVERAARIMEVIPDDGGYLHDQFRKAMAEEERHKEANKGFNAHTAPCVSMNFQPGEAFLKSLQMYLDGMDFDHSPLVVDEIRLDAGNVCLNTALVGGSDELALAAKIHGYCESHAYIEGEDREWLAGIMRSGLDKGIYRRSVFDNFPQGWEKLIDFLKRRNDEPVVMSYSVCDQFPNLDICDFEPDYNDEIRYDKWEAIGEEQQWDLAMTALREQQPWARISPETLRGVMFHLPVSAYDIVHADRDERIKAACTHELETEDEQ